MERFFEALLFFMWLFNGSLFSEGGHQWFYGRINVLCFYEYNLLRCSPMSEVKKRKYWMSAFELTAIYLVVSVLYITFSSSIAAALAPDVVHLEQIELWKGNIFIAVTALLLFFYTRFMLRRDSDRQNELHKHRMALLAAEQHNVSSQMAWTIGHDINNILTIISFNIELLEGKVSEADGSQKLVETLGAATKQLRFLAQKLRDAGKGIDQKEMVNLHLRTVIDDAIDLAQMVRANMTSSIQVHCPEDLMLTGCETVLQQALFNIILNAMDAADLNPCVIEIDAERTDGTVTISVHDNGPGIPEDEEAKIFDTFYTTKERGSGLGLLSAQLCAQIHRGDLTLGTSRLGGACFCMELASEASETGLRLNYAV